MGFDTQERLKKEAVLQNKSPFLKKSTWQECTICMLFKSVEYPLTRRALNADGTAKSWPRKYLFNAEWESCPSIPFSVQTILLGITVQF